MLTKSWFQILLETHGQLALGTANLCPNDPLLPDAASIILEAIKCGVQIIDTASNYEDGNAEFVIGNLEKKILEDVLILTKAGQKIDNELRKNDEFMPDGSFRHWAFDLPSIELCIANSQKRLQRDYIDCVFLHNPEDILLEGIEILPALMPAIEYLERLCRVGVIGCWGISSWSGFFSEDQKPAQIQLNSLIDCLDAYERKHHFLAIQFPFGSWNLNAIRQKGQYSKMDRSFETLFTTANRRGISCLVNSPFQGGDNLPQPAINRIQPTPAQKEILHLHQLVPSATRVIGMRSKKSIEEIKYLQDFISND
jgi:aryl-alcohol dehydrogenase-like predicted oxidoreductase